MSNKVKTMKLAELSRESNYVWVVNTTKAKQKGNVLFTLPQINGNGRDTVTVPSTFLPIDLLTQVTMEQLLKSSEFRRALNFDLIAIIPEEEADRLNSRPGAGRERERLQNLELHGAAVMQDNALEKPVHAQASGDAVIVDQENDGIGLRIRSLMSEVKEGKGDEVGIINTLRTLGEEVNEEELAFVRKKARKYGMTRLAKYCKSTLAEMATEEDD